MRTINYVGLVPLLFGLVACGPGEGGENGTGNGSSGQVGNGAGNGAGNGNGSSGQAAIPRGSEGGACLQGQVCNLPNLCNTSSGLCARDPNAGRQGGACLETGGCNSGDLICTGSICLPGQAMTPPPGPGAGTEGGPCATGNVCLTGLLCSAPLANGDRVCQQDATPPPGSRGGSCFQSDPPSCGAGSVCNVAAGTCDAPPPVSSSSGGPGSSSGAMPGPGGRDYYTANVQAEYTTRCATCHAAGQTIGPAFMGAAPYYDGTLAYNSTVGGSFVKVSPNLQNSLLVVKGEHAGPTSAFTAATKIMVATWLDMEADARGLNTSGGSSSSGGVTPPPGGGPVLTATAAIDSFGKCMLQTDFNANATGTNTNFNNLANQGSTQGACSACHSTGTGGAYISANALNNYTYNKISPYVMKLALPTQKADGTFTMVNSNRWRDKGQETGTHPKYILTAAREAAVNQVFSRTLLRFEANTADCRTVGSGGALP